MSKIEMYKRLSTKPSPLQQREKKVFGKMKDQCVGTAIAECVCLRPKMYSIMKARVRCQGKNNAQKL